MPGNDWDSFKIHGKIPQMPGEDWDSFKIHGKVPKIVFFLKNLVVFQKMSGIQGSGILRFLLINQNHIFIFMKLLKSDW